MKRASSQTYQRDFLRRKVRPPDRAAAPDTNEDYCTINETGLLLPPEVVTVKLAVWRGAFFATAICAVSVFELRTVILRAEIRLPAIPIVAPAAKFVPLNVTIVVVPRTVVLGEIPVIVGVDATGADAFTVKACAALVPAPVVTVTP